MNPASPEQSGLSHTQPLAVTCTPARALTHAPISPAGSLQDSLPNVVPAPSILIQGVPGKVRAA